MHLLNIYLANFYLHFFPFSKFTINPISGEIRTTKALDYEDESQIVLYVAATDHGDPQFSDYTTVYIYLVDYNDNKPQFDKPSYHGKICI